VLGSDLANATLRDELTRIRDGRVALPPGCEITYDLEVVDILEGLLRPTKAEDQLREDYELLRIQLGQRPTACEMFMSGGLQRSTLKNFGSWFGLVRRMGDLDFTQQGLLERLQAFFQEIESSRMERSYKMVALEAMIEEDRLPGTIDLPRLAARFQRIIDRSPRLRKELAETMASQESLVAMLKSNPLRAWAGTKRGKGSNYFALEGDRFSARFDLVAYGQVADATTSETFSEMVREIIEWRLAEYTEQADSGRVAPYRARARQGLELGHAYMREEIPALFGAEFTRGRWLQGFITLENALVLLVTLDKTGKAADHRYEDRFLSDTEFQWQSQNKTTQDSKPGRMIRDHQAMGLPVHLFVRQRAKTRAQKAAPFVYRGELTFERWEGDGPITVWWKVSA